MAGNAERQKEQIWVGSIIGGESTHPIFLFFGLFGANDWCSGGWGAKNVGSWLPGSQLSATVWKLREMTGVAGHS